MCSIADCDSVGGDSLWQNLSFSPNCFLMNRLRRDYYEKDRIFVVNHDIDCW